jgi:hypothetical protein
MLFVDPVGHVPTGAGHRREEIGESHCPRIGELNLPVKSVDRRARRSNKTVAAKPIGEPKRRAKSATGKPAWNAIPEFAPA